MPPEMGDASTSSGGARDEDIELAERQGLIGDRRNSKTLRAAVTQAPREAFSSIVHSWFSRKFATGAAILLPMVITVYISWSFLAFFDGIFSPLYKRFFNLELFGLGFVTSVVFVTCTGVFFSSWLGEGMLSFGEWIIRRLPLVKHVYSASKQARLSATLRLLQRMQEVSAALNPDASEGRAAFQECVLIRHPRHGEFAYGFITGRTVLQTREGDIRLCTVYVPTNHVYVGDIYMLEDKDVIHTNLTVREGLEIVVSVGMAVPPVLSAITKRFT